jgi:hypothetical protein
MAGRVDALDADTPTFRMLSPRTGPTACPKPLFTPHWGLFVSCDVGRCMPAAALINASRRTSDSGSFSPHPGETCAVPPNFPSPSGVDSTIQSDSGGVAFSAGICFNRRAVTGVPPLAAGSRTSLRCQRTSGRPAFRRAASGHRERAARASSPQGSAASGRRVPGAQRWREAQPHVERVLRSIRRQNLNDDVMLAGEIGVGDVLTAPVVHPHLRHA